MSGEKQLWCAVIQAAWDDFTSKRPLSSEGSAQWDRNRRDAVLFLTKKGGDWARSRADICFAAGIDPDALRERAEQYQRETTTCD